MFGIGGAIKAIVALIIVLIVAAGGYFLINLKADLAIAQENSRKLEEGVRLQNEAMAQMRADQEKIKQLNNLKRSLTANKNSGKNAISIKELSTRTVTKIISKMLLDKNLNFGCSNCSWNETIGDIHHIKGRKIENADDLTNLCYLCPNCHRKVHKKMIDKLISLNEQIGDKWKNYSPSVKNDFIYKNKISKINKIIKR